MMLRITRSPGFRAAAVLAVLALVAGLASAGEKSDSKVKVDVKTEKAGADGKQVVTVKIDIEKEWHLYANPVNNDLLETAATRVKFVAGDNAVDAKVDYPKGKRVTVGDETYDVYEDSITIKATVDRSKAGPVKLKLKVQACNDKTQKCLLPGEVVVEVP